MKPGKRINTANPTATDPNAYLHATYDEALICVLHARWHTRMLAYMTPLPRVGLAILRIGRNEAATLIQHFTSPGEQA